MATSFGKNSFSLKFNERFSKAIQETKIFINFYARTGHNLNQIPGKTISADALQRTKGCFGNL